MPADVILTKISRVETRSIWRQYESYRDDLHERFAEEELQTEELERCLWHCSNAIDKLVTKGFEVLLFFIFYFRFHLENIGTPMHARMRACVPNF